MQCAASGLLHTVLAQCCAPPCTLQRALHSRTCGQGHCMISLGPLVMGMTLQELTTAPDFCSGACLLACWPPHSTEGSGLWLLAPAPGAVCEVCSAVPGSCTIC